MSSVDRRGFVRLAFGTCLGLFTGCGGDSPTPVAQPDPSTVSPAPVPAKKAFEKTFDPREKLKAKAEKEAAK